MLTIKSNFTSFRDRQNQVYTPDDLTKLHQNLVAVDMINMRGNISRGFTDAIAKQIIAKLSVKKDAVIVIINDLSFHMYNALTDAGFDGSRIYLAFGKWNKDATPAEDTYVYDLMKLIAKSNFKEELNIITLKEMLNMKHIDGIIANPPYSAIGANITDFIRQNIDYEEYVNLLPANDYKRNTTKDLFNYQSEMEPINNGFADAAVTTHIAKIHKTKVNHMSLEDFERSQYTDRSLDKYFAALFTRVNYAIDSAYRPHYSTVKAESTVANTVLLSIRYPGNKHLPYDKHTDSYKWNMLNSITLEDLKGNIGITGSPNTQFSHYFITFKTDIEKRNLATFMYSDTGFKFLAKVFTALNADSMVAVNHALPKVDWTRSWTVEEILADYGYTPDEIKEVMEDLKNYKGMED